MPSHSERVRRHYDAPPVWRRPSDNAAEQLARRACPHQVCAIAPGGIAVCVDCDAEVPIPDLQEFVDAIERAPAHEEI